MAQAQISRTAWDLIYLLKCALHDRVPDEARVQAIDQQALYKLAKAHSVAAMAAMALERCGVIGEEWKQAKGNSVRRTLLLDAERAEICRFMEERGIWYMPLKGVILKDMYPKLGMREMADNDMLYDVTYQDELCSFMKGRGYSAESVGHIHHDTYYKEPVYNFEMHTALIDPGRDIKWNQYYQDVQSRILPDREGAFAHHFSNEDFYIYMNVHGCKHYKNAGTGIRSLVDTYVYLSAMSGKLDWGYIERECGILGIAEYERQCRQLAAAVFGTGDVVELTEKEQKVLAFCFSSGTYGTSKNRILNELRKYLPDQKQITGWTKIKYLLRRAFPNLGFMMQYSPLVRKHKWLYPGMVLVRLVKGGFFGIGKTIREVSVIQKIKE